MGGYADGTIGSCKKCGGVLQFIRKTWKHVTNDKPECPVGRAAMSIADRLEAVERILFPNEDVPVIPFIVDSAAEDLK